MVPQVGDIIKIHVEPEPISDVLCRTPSTYSYQNLKFAPEDDKEYIICSGNPQNRLLLVQRDDFDVPLGFALVYVSNEPHIVITQVGFQPTPVTVSIVGKVEEKNDIPMGYEIGSKLFVVNL
jgi:hypothetical protein